MTQITHKINIDTKELIQLLIDNGYLDEYFTSADVNNLFISQVNNNEKVAQIEVGLNIGLDYLKSIEDDAQKQFEEKYNCCDNSDGDNEEPLMIKFNLNKSPDVALNSFINEFAKVINKYENGI